MKNYIVFDIGGSSTKVAIIKENSEIIKKDSIRAEANDFEKFKALLIGEIEKAKEEYNIDGVAISAPGAVNSEMGSISGSSALPCINDHNFKKIFGEDLGLKLEIENDANCAALGEVWLGAAKYNSDVLFIVCGTGIGGAVIKDKKIHKGKHLFGGEFGIAVLETEGKEDDLTFKTWSNLGATSSIGRRIAEAKGIDKSEIDGKKAFEMAEAGDEDAIKAIDEFYFNNALGIFNLQYIYDPEKIIIGGAISNREDFIERINEKIDLIMSKIKVATIRPKIAKCMFRNDANLLGALFNYLQRN
ncbi:MAG: ROK family protein [Clostridium sp.]|nr:ROK family protein [Clostridium sp.]